MSKRNDYYTREEDKIINEMRESGYSYVDIGKRLNRSVCGVRNRKLLIDKYGIDKMYYYGEYNQLSRSEAKLYLAMCEYGCLEFEELAKKFKKSVNTVKFQCHKIFDKMQVSSRHEMVYQYWKNKYNNSNL